MTDKFAIHHAQDVIEGLLDGEPPDDRELQELLYLLDEVMRLHNLLDLQEIPGVNTEGMDMTLQERIAYLFSLQHATAETKRDGYKHAIPLATTQLQLFEKGD